ncbi:MAG TPA: DinB family protein [bacterium]|jgi:uncharacterized damage-inducible protein DinB
MREAERIVDQLNRCFDGPAWHGDSVMEILQGVTAQQAAAHPMAEAHSIWEIVRHMAAWQDVARRRIGGERFNPTAEENWSLITDTSDAAWQQMLAALRASHTALKEAAASLGGTELDNDDAGLEMAPYFLLHGVVQHNVYHAGQIALLKKFTVL